MHNENEIDLHCNVTQISLKDYFRNIIEPIVSINIQFQLELVFNFKLLNKSCQRKCKRGRHNNLNQLKSQKIHEMKENQLVRMEELPIRIDFALFPLRIGWRIEWIQRRGGTVPGRSSWVGGPVSHPEIFEFQDVIKIKNKTTIFSQFLKFSNIYFLYREFSTRK